MWEMINPLPHTTNLQQMNILAKLWKLSVNESIILKGLISTALRQVSFSHYKGS